MKEVRQMRNNIAVLLQRIEKRILKRGDIYHADPYKTLNEIHKYFFYKIMEERI